MSALMDGQRIQLRALAGTDSYDACDGNGATLKLMVPASMQRKKTGERTLPEVAAGKAGSLIVVMGNCVFPNWRMQWAPYVLEPRMRCRGVSQAAYI